MKNIKTYGQSLLENANAGMNQEELDRNLVQGIAFSNFYPKRWNVVDLLKMGANPSAEVVIGAGVDPNRRVVPIQVALERQSPDIVKLLIDAGADVNANTPKSGPFISLSLLQLAKYYVENNAHPDDSLKILLNAGADPLTAFKGPIEFVEFFDDIDWWNPPHGKIDPSFEMAVKRLVRGRDLFGDE